MDFRDLSFEDVNCIELAQNHVQMAYFGKRCVILKVCESALILYDT
jgi:hypothetical protein